VSKFALSRISIGRDWLSTFIITVMTKSTPQGEDFVSRFKLNGKEEVDVRVTVNGVGVDFSSFIERLEAEYEERVARGAIDLLKEKCGFAEDAISRLTEHVKRFGRDALGDVDHDGAYTPPVGEETLPSPSSMADAYHGAQNRDSINYAEFVRGVKAERARARGAKL